MLSKIRQSPVLASIAMLIVTAIWGWTFVVVQNAINRMPVMDFLAWRFLGAVVVMMLIQPNCWKGLTWPEVWRGIVLGLFLGAGYITQTYGLVYASASVAGFITGMFVVFTPLIAWIFLRRKINARTWIAVALATAGLGLLGLHGWRLGTGETLVLACALFYALHILGLGEWSSRYPIFRFALIQIMVVAVISLAAAVPNGIVMPPDSSVWLAVGITACLATAGAFIVQTWAQTLVSPARISIVMTMEPVFAGVFGVWLADDPLTQRIVLGMLCVLGAMIIVQLKPIKRKSGRFVTE
ncbi:MAG TPA: DMT family transporter [Dehalococcoidales bacterium]|nr:DMT family transporter [Dehalococcoidales bacterium]